MLDDGRFLKVFKYSETKSDVYYSDEDGENGCMLTFIKEDGEWAMVSWDVIWSKYGSADDITWPIYKRLNITVKV